jgi:hypothetical protein
VTRGGAGRGRGVQEETVAETRMALHQAENGLMFISAVVDAVMELHPSTFKQLIKDGDTSTSTCVGGPGLTQTFLSYPLQLLLRLLLLRLLRLLRLRLLLL